MLTTARAIHRNLLPRVAAVALVLAAFCSGSSYLYERGQVAQALSEQAGWGTELLKARVDAKVAASGRSWQAVVQEVLDDVVGQAPLSALGRFVVVEVNDRTGRDVGRLVRDPAIAAMGVLPPLPDGNTVSVPGVQLGDVLADGRRPLVPVLMVVAGPDGAVGAYLRGVFEVSEETVTRLERRRAKGAAVIFVAVLVTAAVIFPLVRRHVGRLADLSSRLLDANLQSLRVLGSAIAKRDSETDAHNYRVTVYAVRLAEQIGLEGPAVRSLIKGAFLHDVGKIGTPDRVLLKPGRLDEEEFREMKLHVSHGLDIVAGSQWLQDATAVVGCHHEKYDGSGYHSGMYGADIPIVARIFCIADVFDALTSERPYKKALSLERSLQILHEGSGSHFDPVVLAAFEGIAESLYLRLVNGEEVARRDLDGIVDRYFKQDLTTILMDGGL